MSHPVRTAAVAIALVALLGSIAFAVTDKKVRYAGFNNVRPQPAALTLEPRQESCQAGEVLPRDAAAVEYGAQSGPIPRLGVRILTQQGAPLADGEIEGGGGPGLVAIPIPRVRESVLLARVCLSNRGDRPVVLVGMPTGGTGVVVNGRPRKVLLRTAYRRAGEESWLGVAGVVGHRFALAKTRLAGPWTLWAVLGLMAVAGALAVRLVQREADTA